MKCILTLKDVENLRALVGYGKLKTEFDGMNLETLGDKLDKLKTVIKKKKGKKKNGKKSNITR